MSVLSNIQLSVHISININKALGAKGLIVNLKA